MAEIDTSSYLKPTAPKSPLEIAGQFQGLEKNKLSIDQAKLDQVNQAYSYLAREINSLPENASHDDMTRVVTSAANKGLITPQMSSQFINEIPRDPAGLAKFRDEFATKGASIAEAVQYHYGAPGINDNGQQQTFTRQGLRGPPIPVAPPIQKQLPPATTVVTPSGASQLLGPQQPQLPGGALPIQGGLPGQYNPNGTPAYGPPNGVPTAVPIVPSAPPQVRPLPVQQQQGYKPAGPMTGLNPGVSEAATLAGQASGKQLSDDRLVAANYQRDIFPLKQAIPALIKLGPKGTGPGTDTVNHLKSFVLSNVPGVDANTFKGLDDVATYDKAKKYLTDYVNQTGNSGTNDKLAAAFAGNPSVGISNAAAVDVAKSALTLRRMRHAQLLAFEAEGLPEAEYSRWASKFVNNQDVRAYGFDMMDAKAQQKLLNELKKSPSDMKKFYASLKVANDNGLLD